MNYGRSATDGDEDTQLRGKIERMQVRVHVRSKEERKSNLTLGQLAQVSGDSKGGMLSTNSGSGAGLAFFCLLGETEMAKNWRGMNVLVGQMSLFHLQDKSTGGMRYF